MTKFDITKALIEKGCPQESAEHAVKILEIEGQLDEIEEVVILDGIIACRYRAHYYREIYDGRHNYAHL